MDSNSLSAIDNYFETKELTGYEPVLGGELTEKAVWVDESRCIGCRYCAHVATNTFVVDDDYGRSRAIRQDGDNLETCLLYTSPSPRDRTRSRMPSSA